MIGYVFGNKTGAFCYNLFHHRGIAIALYFSGIYSSNSSIQISGVILFSHSSLDRMFGYGLKDETGFNYTHFDEIGKK